MSIAQPTQGGPIPGPLGAGGPPGPPQNFGWQPPPPPVKRGKGLAAAVGAAIVLAAAALVVGIVLEFGSPDRHDRGEPRLLHRRRTADDGE
jgi:hypothetical protein